MLLSKVTDKGDLNLHLVDLQANAVTLNYTNLISLAIPSL